MALSFFATYGDFFIEFITFSVTFLDRNAVCLPTMVKVTGGWRLGKMVWSGVCSVSW